jgi:hypothetical protein
MAMDTFWERALYRRSLRRWSETAERSAAMSLDDLKSWRGKARTLRRQIDRVLHQADHRLALPVIGPSAIPAPIGTDWSWRPSLWRGPVSDRGYAAAPVKQAVAEDATLFHDCRDSELTIRQVRNLREADIAPFGLRLDVFRFDGSFLSLAIDLPAEAVNGLKLRHLVRLTCVVELERPLEIFARLNVRHGPNTEQIVRELPLGSDEVMVEFDLSYSRMNEKRVERAWVDIIFEGPQMNQIVLRDVTLSRRPRAEV